MRVGRAVKYDVTADRGMGLRHGISRALVSPIDRWPQICKLGYAFPMWCVRVGKERNSIGFAAYCVGCYMQKVIKKLRRKSEVLLSHEEHT